MPEHKDERGIRLMDLQIGLTIVFCLLLCHVAEALGLQLPALAACTGAVMCVEDSAGATYRTSLTRILGVVCGGVTGVAVVLADNAIGSPYVFYLLCGIGVVVNLVLCRLIRLVYVQARVSCMTMLLVALAFQGTARLSYALGRFIGALVGAAAALAVTMVFAALAKKKPRQ